MTKTAFDQLKFPIGPFICPKQFSTAQTQAWIETIRAFPKKVKALTDHLTATELNWCYRPQGWTIKQVVHHCADSHMNSLIRFKLALTEDTPSIRPYYEDRWAELPDSTTNDLSTSLLLLEGLHAKWTLLLKSLNANELKKEFVHPEHGQRFSINENIGIYAWHCAHHTAHIEQALKAKGAYND